MRYRHEVKHEISRADRLILRGRLAAVMKPDPHAVNGEYVIRSLYFDTPTDRALREKSDGVSEREKFRIRLYNGDTSFICLEKKSRVNDLCRKDSERITPETVRALLNGDFSVLKSGGNLSKELYSKMTCGLLRPKTVVEYTREPFVFVPGNVRVTIDREIRTSVGIAHFLDADAGTVPAGEDTVILEVKWDEFLPDIIRDAVGADRCRTAFSKYARCRIYG